MKNRTQSASSLAERDASQLYQWRDGRCPYCKRYPIHVAMKDDGTLRHELGGFFQAKVKGRDFYPTDGFGGRQLFPAGPRWQMVTAETWALRCFERCGATWLLSDAELLVSWKRAVDDGKKFFMLPLRETRPR